jgi:hypothetical protein
MRIPSFQKISRDVKETSARFPLPIISAVAGTTAALILIDHEGPARPTVLWSVLFCGILGIPLLTGTSLFVEKSKSNPPVGWSINIAALLLLVAYACIIPPDLSQEPAIHAIRLLLLAFAAHLFAAFGPFMTGNGINGFWQYNKTLFLRILVAALFAHVVFAGLAFALAALDNLFGMQIPGKRYGELWVLATGLFTTWYFLAGIPKNLDECDASTDYPKGLKVFAQYILLPIVLVYLVILYAYIGKILISWDWPQGWVSKLILGFSGTGILSLLLLYPVSRQTENVWIRTVTRWFYVVLIPVVAMLFFAVWRRVSEYGFTEGRYLAIALGAWLVIVILYFLLLPRKNIKFIPVSLCLGTLLVVFGPWSVFTVSEKSQVSRLEALLQKHAILVDGKVQKNGGNIPSNDTREISAVLTYLHDLHGYDSIQPWFKDPLKEDPTTPGVKYKEAADIAGIMGVDYARPRQEYGGVILLTTDRDRTVEISGYSSLLRAQHVHTGRAGTAHRFGTCSYRASNDLDILTVVFHREGSPRDSLSIDVGNLVKTVLRAHENHGADDIQPSAMSAEAASKSLRLRVCLSEARLQRVNEEIKILSYTADILYSVVPEE